MSERRRECGGFERRGEGRDERREKTDKGMKVREKRDREDHRTTAKQLQQREEARDKERFSTCPTLKHPS